MESMLSQKSADLDSIGYCTDYSESIFYHHNILLYIKTADIFSTESALPRNWL